MDIPMKEMSLPGIPLIPGEKTLCILTKDISYVCNFNGTISGKLIVTNYKLFFYGSNPNGKVLLTFFLITFRVLGL